MQKPLAHHKPNTESNHNGKTYYDINPNIIIIIYITNSNCNT